MAKRKQRVWVLHLDGEKTQTLVFAKFKGLRDRYIRWLRKECVGEFEHWKTRKAFEAELKRRGASEIFYTYMSMWISLSWYNVFTVRD